MTKRSINGLIYFFLFMLSLNCSLEATYAQGIMFPFYIYPTTENIQPLLDAKQQYPDLPLRVILNPDSGVGKKRNPYYVSAIKTLKAAGSKSWAMCRQNIRNALWPMSGRKLIIGNFGIIFMASFLTR